MKRAAMLRRLKAGYDPIKIAIEKWEDVKKGIDLGGGTQNCALCEISTKKYGIRNCRGCPIPLSHPDLSSCVYHLDDPDKMLKLLHETEAWLEDQKCKEREMSEEVERPEREKIYNIGDRILIDSNDDIGDISEEYILARCEYRKAVLISVESGNRWTDPIAIKNNSKVTIKEMNKMIPYYKWKEVEEEE